MDIRNPQGLLDAIAGLRKLRDAQEILFSELEVWARLALQGVDIDQVKAAGYDPKTDKRWEPRGHLPRRSETHPLASVYNYVVLKDGTRQPITPIPVSIRRTEESANDGL